MTNEPNNEQARELSEKELEGIAGGTRISQNDLLAAEDQGSIPPGFGFHEETLRIYNAEIGATEAVPGLALR